LRSGTDRYDGSAADEEKVSCAGRVVLDAERVDRVDNQGHAVTGRYVVGSGSDPAELIRAVRKYAPVGLTATDETRQ
jgi:hypothetical protein